jgi:enoyl-CoA hydratase/carnithine racemase
MCALLANVIVAGEGATFHDVPPFAGGIVPGDGIFTTWSYRAGAGRAEAFLLNRQPRTAQTAHQWGVIAEVVPNGKCKEKSFCFVDSDECWQQNRCDHLVFER